MFEAFGQESLKSGQYLWRDEPGDGDPRVVISLTQRSDFRVLLPKLLAGEDPEFAVYIRALAERAASEPAGTDGGDATLRLRSTTS